MCEEWQENEERKTGRGGIGCVIVPSRIRNGPASSRTVSRKTRHSALKRVSTEWMKHRRSSVESMEALETLVGVVDLVDLTAGFSAHWGSATRRSARAFSDAPEERRPRSVAARRPVVPPAFIVSERIKAGPFSLSVRRRRFAGLNEKRRFRDSACFSAESAASARSSRRSRRALSRDVL